MEESQLVIENCEIDLNIANETNQDIQEIAKEVRLLPNLLQSIQTLIWEQANDIISIYDSVEESKRLTEEGVNNLESTERHIERNNKVRDVSIIAGGTALGGIGWIGGPWIGIPATGLGVGISTGIVFIMRKLGV